MKDIVYCTEDNCRITNCIKNRKNVNIPAVIHRWVNKEEVPECPFNQINQKLKYTDQDTLMPAT